jgi:hypothetical protein
LVGWLPLEPLSCKLLFSAFFINASDFSNDDGDFVYSFRCPLNSEGCSDEWAVSAYGWAMWLFLILASLLDDLVNGVKLVTLSASRKSFRSLLCGMVLFGVASLAIFTSAMYNQAIALTDTELIVNAVILLFVNEVDEQIFKIVQMANRKFLKKVVRQAETYSEALLLQSKSSVGDEDNNGSNNDEPKTTFPTSLAPEKDERREDDQNGKEAMESSANKDVLC